MNKPEGYQPAAVSPTREGDMWEQNPVLFAGQSQRKAIMHSRLVQARMSGASGELAVPPCSLPSGIWI